MYYKGKILIKIRNLSKKVIEGVLTKILIYYTDKRRGITFILILQQEYRIALMKIGYYINKRIF